MSRLYVIGVAVALLALAALPAMAGGPAPQTDVADVTLTIDQYCEIAYGTVIAIVVTDGGAAGSYTSTAAPYSASANFAATISGVVVAPTGAPGTWTNSLTLKNVGPASSPGTGNATVTVSGLSISTPAASYLTGGTLTLTIQ